MIELPTPPGYEYETIGPWWLTSLDDNERATVSTQMVLDTAVTMFWANNHGNTGSRRVLIDARGIAILGIDGRSQISAMIGIRQTMNATLAMVERDTEFGIEERAVVLGMVERIRQYNGGAR